MSRNMKPANRAIQDQILATLEGAYPDAMTTTTLATRVDARRLQRGLCLGGLMCRQHGMSYSADIKFVRHTTDAERHLVDEWTCPLFSYDMGPFLNRLLRDGLVTKYDVPGSRRKLWSFILKDSSRAELNQLEDLWEMCDE